MREQEPGQNLVQRTTVSRLLAAVPVHLPMILSIHFLWMAALHSGEYKMNTNSYTPHLTADQQSLYNCVYSSSLPFEVKYGQIVILVDIFCEIHGADFIHLRRHLYPCLLSPLWRTQKKKGELRAVIMTSTSGWTADNNSLAILIRMVMNAIGCKGVVYMLIELYRNQIHTFTHKHTSDIMLLLVTHFYIKNLKMD